ncbi:two-component system sensor histidine kinase NtrB [Lacunimicrobium album]
MPSSSKNDANAVLAENQRLAEKCARLETRLSAIDHNYELYRVLAETATDAIISVDSAGLIIYVNESVAKLFGVEASSLVGRPLMSLIPVEFQASHEAAFARFQRTHERTMNWSGVEAHIFHSSGTKIPVEISFACVKDASGKYSFTGYVRDIRQRKATEEFIRRRIDDLAHVHRLNTVGELAGGLAHELNQPLSAICLQSDLLRQMIAERTDIEQNVTDTLSDIAMQAERAASIIRSLRAMIRKSEPSRAPVDLNEIIRSAVSFSNHYTNHGKAEVKLHLQASLPTVYADRTQLEQVLLNLIYNALDAMPVSQKDDRVCIIRSQFDSQSPSILIEVADFGQGITGADYEKVFEQFYTTKIHGMGLGLAICRRIIQSHGGRLTAGPNHPRGAIFQIVLPVSHAQLEQDSQR